MRPVECWSSARTERLVRAGVSLFLLPFRAAFPLSVVAMLQLAALESPTGRCDDQLLSKEKNHN